MATTVTGIGGLSTVILGDTSDSTPALVSHKGCLFLAWRGLGNDMLNVMFSADNGATFGGKVSFGNTSSTGPALAAHTGGLFLAWKGSGNANLSVARVGLITANTPPPPPTPSPSHQGGSPIRE